MSKKYFWLGVLASTVAYSMLTAKFNRRSMRVWIASTNIQEEIPNSNRVPKPAKVGAPVHVATWAGAWVREGKSKAQGILA